MNGAEHDGDRFERRHVMAATMHARAVGLRARAHSMHPLVAVAYRRRAAELELTSRILELRHQHATAERGSPARAA